MRIFHELVADDFVTDTNGHLSRIHWNAVMGNFETMRLVVVADHVSGVPDPKMNLWIVESADNSETTVNFLPILINNATLPANQTTVLTAAIGPTDLNPPSYTIALYYLLVGTAPLAVHFRIWVTGRGRA